ncbi:hypothetical protein Q4Q34_18820 [Flavivirga abyssicola]|uniref:hypothetical protein n=1 Tax=Flavivirga abyssicola TaxID=3063533 RepID=UPI0026E0B3CD|nr:hypothetical protein [Flavivirga sp. MEBiC07777]WVK13269.1 hypothetical protein Q4Q34_18820 [Flavivirga sp. MEBiC07777]
MKINKSNYEFYKGVFKVIWEFEAKYAKMDPNADFSPINVLQNWEKESDSLARRGLREGLRDSLTVLKDVPTDIKTELNSSLISKNFPSINILTSQIRNVPKKVLEKGKIKNLDEYYVIKEVLDDLEYEITESERTDLNKIFGEFERNYKEKNVS